VIPITILSGFLGSGKSTLISHLRNNNEKIVVLDNDAEAIRVENDLACFPLSQNIQNSLEEVLTLSDLRKDGGYDRILIECSGISDPDAMRREFQDMPLKERVRLESMVTVVDASTFLSYLKTWKGVSMKESPELYCSLQEEKSEGVADRFISQIEIADVILINKCDLVSDDIFRHIEEIVQTINPNAETIPTKYGQVETNRIFPQHDPDYVTVAGFSTSDDHRLLVDSIHQNPGINIASFVYTVRKPFHPIRWSSFLLKYLGSSRGIIRSKGFIWLANSHMAAMYWSHATSHYEIRRLGGW